MIEIVENWRGTTRPLIQGLESVEAAKEMVEDLSAKHPDKHFEILIDREPLLAGS